MPSRTDKNIIEGQTKIRSLLADDFELVPYSAHPRSRTKVDEEVRKKQLENDAFLQDMELKRTTLNRLFIFLACETILVFSFALCQGTGWLNFSLEEWSFKLVVTATLIQITFMLQVAVKHLFPQRK